MAYKNIALSICAIVIGVLSMPAHAKIWCSPWPICIGRGYVYDSTALLRTVQQMEQSARQFLDVSQQFIDAEILAQANKDAKTANDDNISANKILRTTQSEVDLHNLEQAKEALAAPDACETEDIIRRIEDAECASENYLSSRGSVFVTHQIAPAASPKSVYRNMVNEVENRFASTNGHIDASLLFGAKTDVFAEDDLAAVELLTKLVTEPVTDMPDERRELLRGDIYMERKNKQYMEIARMSMAQSAILSAASRRIAENSGDSHLSLLKENASLDKLSAVNHADVGQAQVFKSLQAAKAFRAYMAVERYEQSLEQEALLAVALARRLHN